LGLDSVGIRDAPDADAYGDAGANTLGHILEHRPELQLPNLDSLGLRELIAESGHAEARPSGGTCFRMSTASVGKMRERSAGKDTRTCLSDSAGVILG